MLLAFLIFQQPIVTPYTKREPLAIRSVTPSSVSVPQWGLAELKVDLAATYDNPFDPQDVTLDALATGPDGKTLQVPGFYYRSYQREVKGKEEALSPAGEPEWRVRFSPPTAGAYTILLKARDRSGSATSEPVRLTATPSAQPGFVRVSSKDSRFFAFDNGSSYWPLGPNVCWGGSLGTFSFDDWLPKYGAQGANYSRVWLSPSWTTFALEQPGKASEGKGMGQFDLANLWRLDYVLDLAGRNGMYLMLCIDSYNILRPKDAYPWWEKTPHNVDNGGPLRLPTDFWTNAKMDKLYKDKLRYLVARYGANSHVLSWEFWNEVDLTADFDEEVVRDWHQRMATYLRSIDPYNHLITTSAASTQGHRPIDLLPELSYFQTHHYGPDPAGTVTYQQSRKGGQGKPHYVGEIGADAGGARKEDDPKGIQVHDPMWASIATGSSGNAASWWWDSLIGPNNLYPLYGAVHRFVQDVDWQSEGFRQRTPSFTWASRPAVLPRADLEFSSGPASWDKSDANVPKRIVIRNGKASGPLPLASIQHGVVNHPDLHNPVLFDVSVDRPTTFEVEVGEVSGYGGAKLEISLDGSVVYKRDFADPDGNEKSDTITKYSGKYTISVPAGQHVVKVENTGVDWFMVAYRFKNLLAKTKPEVEGWSVIGDTKVLAWVRREGRTWRRAIFDKLPPAAPSIIGFSGLAAGKWKAEVWDTWAGKAISTSTLRVDLSGRARVPLPRISRDVAVKLSKQ